MIAPTIFSLIGLLLFGFGFLVKEQAVFAAEYNNGLLLMLVGVVCWVVAAGLTLSWTLG